MKSKSEIGESLPENELDFSIIFREFIEETKSIPVIVSFHPNSDGDINNDFSIEVAGCSDEYAFKKKLRRQMEKGIASFKSALTKYSSDEKVLLIKDFIDEIIKLRNDLIETGPSVIESKEGQFHSITRITLLIKTVKYYAKRNDNSKAEKTISATVIDKYANALNEIINETKDVLKNALEQNELGNKTHRIFKTSKLKTSLNADQLVYLIKSLESLGIFIHRSNSELFRWIANSFETKKAEEISESKIANLYYTPNEKEKDFWQEKFYHLGNLAKKDKKTKPSTN